MTDFLLPRLEHVMVDEETQMQKYLAEIAMEDLLLASGTRTERPDGLLAQYKRMVAVEHEKEANFDENFTDNSKGNHVEIFEFRENQKIL